MGPPTTVALAMILNSQRQLAKHRNGIQNGWKKGAKQRIAFTTEEASPSQISQPSHIKQFVEDVILVNHGQS
jgi:hypothetical protein